MNMARIPKIGAASKQLPYAALTVAATSFLGWSATNRESCESNKSSEVSPSPQLEGECQEKNSSRQSAYNPLPMTTFSFIPTTRCLCEAAHDGTQSSSWSLRDAFFRKRGTVEKLEQLKTKGDAERKYDWDKDKPVGQGAYSRVYKATTKDAEHETVALKEISKKYTNDQSFQQEMEAMLYVQEQGGHPHLIALHEHFETDDSFILVLDYIEGGELFDHLIENGAYSEMDASRIIREVASALNFLHGIGIVHADLKPENILLSTSRRGDSVTKVADFGTAVFVDGGVRKKDEEGRIMTRKNVQPVYGAPTPAYCPPESIQRTEPIQPATDMWALGVILFIMLTGCHPYDVNGKATDEEIEANIKDRWYRIPIHSRKVAGHLSPSAKDLIIKLMDRNNEKRMTAYEMLQHPWVRGETATTAIIAGSDKRLSDYKGFKSKLQAKFFENAIKWSDQEASKSNPNSRLSLIERSFKAFDAGDQGFLTTKAILGEKGEGVEMEDIQEGGGPAINMTEFKSLLSENVENKYYPSGHVVYREGSTGNSMYFIESGTVEVIADGTRAVRKAGDFFGEGALLSADKIRSATVKCQTPVHVLEISREYFEKYISYSESGLYLILKEKDKIRKRNRAKTILRMQKDLKTVSVPRRGKFFSNGDEGDSVFIVESGKVDVEIKGKAIFSCFPGNIIGEHSVITGHKRNCDAKCASKEGCVAQELPGHHFRKLLESSPSIRESLRELQLRREFKKAVVNRTQKEFPYENPEKAFEAADIEQVGRLDKESIAKLMRELNPEYTDEEIDEVVQSLNLTESGVITFAEMKKALIGDKQASASM